MLLMSTMAWIVVGAAVVISAVLVESKVKVRCFQKGNKQNEHLRRESIV